MMRRIAVRMPLASPHESSLLEFTMATGQAFSYAFGLMAELPQMAMHRSFLEDLSDGPVSLMALSPCP